jgi:hypothetical protein
MYNFIRQAIALTKVTDAQTDKQAHETPQPTKRDVTNPTRDTRNREFVILAMASALGAMAIGGIGWVPTHRIAGDAGVTAMGAGIGVSVFGSLLAALPIAFGRDPSPSGRQVAFLGAMAARMFSTIILVVIVLLTGSVAKKPFALWTGLSYVVLLAVETAVTVHLTNKRSSR